MAAAPFLEAPCTDNLGRTEKDLVDFKANGGGAKTEAIAPKMPASER